MVVDLSNCGFPMFLWRSVEGKYAACNYDLGMGAWGRLKSNEDDKFARSLVRLGL